MTQYTEKYKTVCLRFVFLASPNSTVRVPENARAQSDRFFRTKKHVLEALHFPIEPTNILGGGKYKPKRLR